MPCGIHFVSGEIKGSKAPTRQIPFTLARNSAPHAEPFPQYSSSPVTREQLRLCSLSWDTHSSLPHRKHPALPSASAVSFIPQNVAECFQLPVSLQSSKTLCLQILTAPSSSRVGTACCCQHWICTFWILALEEAQDGLNPGEFSHQKLGATASDSVPIPSSQCWSRKQSLLHPILPWNAGCRSRAARVVLK